MLQSLSVGLVLLQMMLSISFLGTVLRPHVGGDLPLEPQAYYWVPYRTIRDRMRDIEVEQIDHVEFYGDELLHQDANTRIRVTDRDLIRRIIAALKQATKPSDLDPVDVATRGGWTEGNCAVTLVLRTDKEPEPVAPAATATVDTRRTFYFSATSPRNCFGPRFFAVLKELEDYQAKQVRQFVATHADEIAALRFSSFEQAEWADWVTDQTVIHRFSSAIAQSDKRIFRCTLPTGRIRPITQLKLKNGTVVDLCLVLARLRHPSPSNPPWLRELWKLVTPTDVYQDPNKTYA